MMTLATMSRMSTAGAIDPTVRLTALEIVKALPQKDFQGEAIAIFRFVRDKIRYVRDVYRVETVQEPRATLELGQGDCDDKSTLLAALLASVGVETAFGALVRGNSVMHVWTRAKIAGKWVNLDATENLPMGQLPKFNKSDRIIHHAIGSYDPLRDGRPVAGGFYRVSRA